MYIVFCLISLRVGENSNPVDRGRGTAVMFLLDNFRGGVPESVL
jgi:hypothetical protein